MFLELNISSKNYLVLKNFLSFLNNSFIKKKLSFVIYTVHLKKIKTKKKFSILKSPHVNKTAQEQLEFITYKCTVLIYSYKVLLVLFLIKHIKLKLFSELSITIIFKYSFKKFIKSLVNKLHVNNLVLNTLLSKNQKNYLQMLDLYGEILLKGLNSSVG